MSEAIFAPVRAAMAQRNYTAAEVFHVIAEFAGGPTPHVGAAMSSHVSDILSELVPSTDNRIDFNLVAGEMYWRTFFSQQHATLYGTQSIVERGPQALQNFADFLLTSFQLDDIQDRSASAAAMDSK